MGQAKQRGTLEERKAKAIARNQAFQEAIDKGELGAEVKQYQKLTRKSSHRLLNAMMMAGLISAKINTNHHYENH